MTDRLTDRPTDLAMSEQTVEPDVKPPFNEAKYLALIAKDAGTRELLTTFLMAMNRQMKTIAAPVDPALVCATIAHAPRRDLLALTDALSADIRYALNASGHESRGDSCNDCQQHHLRITRLYTNPQRWREQMRNPQTGEPIPQTREHLVRVLRFECVAKNTMRVRCCNA